MILAEPPHGQGDIHFNLFGIPVRVHPFFWVVAVLLVIRGEPKPAQVLIWVVAMFVSIVVHEMGHAWLQRRYGGHPRIVLYGLGGLAISEHTDRSSRAQILISLAGPIAGFLFAALLFLFAWVTGHRAGFSIGTPNIAGYSLNLLGVKLYWEAFSAQHLNVLFGDLMQINILWGLINLLPIYPLDGGQISRELCQVRHPSQGIVLSLRISMITAIGMALFGLSRGDFFVVLMFGYLAYSSYRTLEAYRTSSW